MFTGLVERAGRLIRLQQDGPGARMVVDGGDMTAAAKLGDSIAVSGCCLTVVASEASAVAFDVGPETLRRTVLGDLAVDSRVNLERSLRMGDELGGHLVTGHIDGVGQLVRREDEQEWSTFWITAPPQLMRQMASKGSIAVDGVSLTLVDVDDESFSVALIPHTLDVTTLGMRQVGDRFNLETDVLAKYVERQLEFRQP